MNSFGVVLLCLKITAWLLQTAREAKLYSQGQEDQLRQILQEQASAFARAKDIREEVRRRNAAVPASEQLPDDGFRRD